MRYTWKISFNNWSTDYDLYPVNHPVMTTTADAGTFRYRTEVDELKISKHLNSVVFGILENMYHNQSDFDTEIQVRQYKDASIKWTGIFGIKHGKLNSELCTYIITPTAYDNYMIIDQSLENYATKPLGQLLLLINEDDDYTTISANGQVSKFETCIANAITKINSDSGLSFGYKSSTFWNDTLPGGGIGSDYYYRILDRIYIGYAWDYVTAADRFVIEDMFDVFNLVNCFWYVDSDGNIRAEHLKYYEDLINDYAIDLTGNDAIQPEFEYINQETYLREIFKQASDITDPDWDTAEVVYEGKRTTFRNSQKEYDTEFITLIDSDFANQEKILTCATDNLVSGWQSEGGWDTWSSVDTSSLGIGKTYESIGVIATYSSGSAHANSNILSGGTYSYSITAFYTSGAGNLRIKPNTGGSPITINAGANTGNITIPTDGYIILEPTGACDFNLVIKVTLTGGGGLPVLRVIWDEATISGDKKANWYFSWGDIVENFYKHGRYSLKGDMNRNAETFESTVYNKRLKEFKLYHPDDINPLHGVLTDYGVAKIESYKRSEDDYVTFTLTFQEDA